MPIKIDCPECGGRGWWYPLSEIGGSTKVPCSNCKDGKITVYTQKEMDVLKERNNKLKDWHAKALRRQMKLEDQNEEIILTLELFIEEIEDIPQWKDMVESARDQIQKIKGE